jgi:predicted MFS family arabinose efflux permease
MTASSQSSKRFFLFSILSALFVLSMFYRVSSAVIAPNLMHDLRLNAENLGVLGGAFFYSFALFQIPMGPMLDRIGPRIVITSFSMIGALGACVFAFGNSFLVALLGRILMGVGMASVLMGSMKVFVIRYPAKEFVTLIGLMQAIGALGNIFAASPLAFLTSMIGWRMTFVIAGAVTVLLAFMVFLVLGEEKGNIEGPGSSPSSQPGIGILQSFRLLLGSLTFWQIGAIAFFRYGTFVGLQGLWLGPYLIDIKRYSPVQTGHLLIFLAIGIIVGGPIAGWLSDRTFHSKKGVALGGLSLYCLSLLLLIDVVKLPSAFLFGLLFFFTGFFCSFGMVIYAHAKEFFPIAISGTVMAGVNFFTMGGPALFMPALGKVIESFPRTGSSYPAEAYHLSFFICFLGMTASLIFYAFSRRK